MGIVNGVMKEARSSKRKEPADVWFEKVGENCRAFSKTIYAFELFCNELVYNSIS